MDTQVGLQLTSAGDGTGRSLSLAARKDMLILLLCYGRHQDGCETVADNCSCGWAAVQRAVEQELGYFGPAKKI